MRSHSSASRTWYIYIPVVSAGVSSLLFWLIYLWGAYFMGYRELITAIIAATATLLAAIVGGIISLIVQGRQLKRDGKTIDETKVAVTDIKPKVDNTNLVVNDVEKSVSRIEERSSKIDFIATEMEVYKRMKSEAGGNGIQPDVLIASMSSVFEENARLRKQYQNARLQIRKLSLENEQLKDALQKTRSNDSNDLPEYEFDP